MATKKIKDFTIGEIAEICNKYVKNRCNNCPFGNHCLAVSDGDDLEREIEVEDEPQRYKSLKGLC